MEPALPRARHGALRRRRRLDSFDMLSAVVDWVEQGIAPASVMATGRTLPGRSRPLCAYRRHAHYKGVGDPTTRRTSNAADASNALHTLVAAAPGVTAILVCGAGPHAGAQGQTVSALAQARRR